MPASPGTVHPPKDGCPLQPVDRLTIDSDASRFLIVDDDPGTLELVSAMAASLGYCATAAVDAIDALYFLEKTRYHVVISDYEMPLMDGFQLARRIKKKYCGIRVIIMTGHREDCIANMLSGSDVVDGLLLKPFNLKTMQAQIERVVRSVSGKWTS
jgi:CheY-like chemotaxis protein